MRHQPHLSGGTPLFPAAHKREGYLRVAPRHPAAVEAAAYHAPHATGTFGLPLYLRLKPAFCAHSRARQTGCTRCLDACPTGAIRPDGDHVAVDPHACAGCGAWSALCPFGALASGFADVSVLLAPRSDRQVIEAEARLAAAIAARPRCGSSTSPTPTPCRTRSEPPPAGHDPALPIGSRRQIIRLAAKALGGEGQIPLPQGAPYGAVRVDTDACTLCLACVPLCPSGALGDNPDLPQLLFQEEACPQCGLCASICPEDAITLEPRLNLSGDALSQVVLNEEEPFAASNAAPSSA